MDKVLAILCSDIHLSLKAPIARSAEISWLEAMKRPLDELKSLAKKHDAIIVYAGDIFDKAVGNSELINFAIDNLPKGYSVWGQHDAPLHSADELHKSSYWTMVKIHHLIDLNPKNKFGTQCGKLVMYGFPWGSKIKSLEEEYERYTNTIHLAVVHHYLYTNKSNSYPGVSKENHLSKIRAKLKGYDAAVFGDNHIGFTTTIGKCNVMNTGTLLRRKIDEINYKPQVGLLHDDGSITPHFLDTSEDKFIDIEEAREKEQLEIDADEFLKELRGLGSDSLDFRHAVNTHMDKKEIDPEVRKLIMESLEE